MGAAAVGVSAKSSTRAGSRSSRRASSADDDNASVADAVDGILDAAVKRSVERVCRDACGIGLGLGPLDDECRIAGIARAEKSGGRET